MSRVSTAVASASALLAATPAGAAALASVSTYASALLAAAFPAGPVLALVLAGIKANVRDIAAGWAARDRCRAAAWLRATELAAAATDGQAFVPLSDLDTASDPHCWHRGLKTSDRKDGRLSYRPGGKAAGIVVREDVADATTAGIYGLPAGFQVDWEARGLSLCPWMGPFAHDRGPMTAPSIPPHEEAAALCLAAATAADASPPPRAVCLSIAERWRQRAADIDGFTPGHPDAARCLDAALYAEDLAGRAPYGGVGGVGGVGGFGGSLGGGEVASGAASPAALLLLLPAAAGAFYLLKKRRR